MNGEAPATTCICNSEQCVSWSPGIAKRESCIVSLKGDMASQSQRVPTKSLNFISPLIGIRGTKHSCSIGFSCDRINMKFFINICDGAAQKCDDLTQNDPIVRHLICCSACSTPQLNLQCVEFSDIKW